MPQQHSSTTIHVAMTACLFEGWTRLTVLLGCFGQTSKQKFDHTIGSGTQSQTPIFLSIVVKWVTTDRKAHQLFIGLDLWQSFDIPRKFSCASVSNISPYRLTHNL